MNTTPMDSNVLLGFRLLTRGSQAIPVLFPLRRVNRPVNHNFEHSTWNIERPEGPWNDWNDWNFWNGYY